MIYQVISGPLVVCSQCLFCNSALFRLKGLLGKAGLGAEEGIWLKPCNSIHMFFMKFPIDALFLDKDLRIVKIYHSIQPWRISSLIFKASSVVEIQAGRAKLLNLEVGDQLNFHEV